MRLSQAVILPLQAWVFVAKKEDGAMEWMWSMALVVLMVAGRPGPLLWPSSCADLLKVITNSTFIWGVTGPREDLNTVVVLFTYRRRLL